MDLLPAGLDSWPVHAAGPDLLADLELLLAGAEGSADVAAKFRLSIEQIRAATEVSRVAARARGLVDAK